MTHMTHTVERRIKNIETKLTIFARLEVSGLSKTFQTAIRGCSQYVRCRGAQSPFASFASFSSSSDKFDFKIKSVNWKNITSSTNISVCLSVQLI